MIPHYLKNKAKNLSQESGVYLFKDERRQYLYIGKATNLKSRVSSYLKTKDIRIKKMISLAKSLEHIATESDIEALILESQLIKKFRPLFNIVLRDDKQYAFVGFTKEKYPKIFITHQPEKNDNFIGPFTDIGALKATLRYLRRVFPYCTCNQLHHNYCLNHHIGKCLGFCCLKSAAIKEDDKTYTNNINAIKKILNGKKTSFVKEIKKEAEGFARKDDFEKAIELRDKITKLERIFENAKIIKNSNILKSHRSGLESLLKLQKPIVRIEGYDVSNIGGAHATGSMVTFVHGQQDKNFYRKFKIHPVRSSLAEVRRTRAKSASETSYGIKWGDTQMLAQVLERRFKHYEWPFPDLILVDGGKQQLRSVEAVVNPKSEILNPKQIQNSKFKNSKQIPIIALTKDKKHKGNKIYVSGRKTPIALTKLSPADRNLLLAIDSEAHRFAIGYYRKLHRKLFR